MQPIKVVKQPRISLNKLGEYLHANPARRKKIVEDAKYPVNFIRTRYSYARTVIQEYFSSNFDENILDEGIDNLINKRVESEFEENDRDCSIEALEAVSFIDMTELIDTTKLSISIYRGENRMLNISGVDVSVKPNLIIRGKYRGSKVVGAIKIHISKNHRLNNQSAADIANILRNFLEENVVEEDEKVEPKFCISMDVFDKSFEPAPKAFKRRIKYAVSACEEIALWWNKI